MTRSQMRNFAIELFTAVALGTALAFILPQTVRAETISTDDALAAQQPANASGDRARLKALVERPELAQQLEKFGITPEKAEARVDAMSDAEVRMVVGKLDSLPAGAAISNTDFLLVVIIIILVVVLL